MTSEGGDTRLRGLATRPQIALEQIRAAVAAGVPKALVLAPAAYSADAISAWG